MMAAKKPAKKKYSRSEKYKANLFRASELPSPANPGHPLDAFGQSDRKLVNNSTTSANIMQALFLLNSGQINGLIAKASTPVKEAHGKSTDEQIDILYLGFLSRYPTAKEKAALQSTFEKSPDDAKNKVAWAMINSNQFLFLQ